MRRLMFVLAVTVATVACSKAPERPARWPYEEAAEETYAPGPGPVRNAFTVKLPDGFRVEEVPTKADFALFRIVRDDKPYVGLYLGNFPDIEDDGETSQREWRGKRRTLVAVENGEKRIRGYLVKTGWDFPAYIHVMVFDVPGDQATANRIGRSVRANPKAMPRRTPG